MAHAWGCVPGNSIRKSWNNPVDRDGEDDLPLFILQDKMRSISQKILEPRTQEEEDEDFELLKDDDIVESVLNPVKGNSTYTGNDSMLPTIEENMSFFYDTANDNEGSTVSHEAAINGFNLILMYTEENDDR